jgi:hypothetical protein
MNSKFQLKELRKSKDTNKDFFAWILW